jgi:hypothetical protein
MAMTPEQLAADRRDARAVLELVKNATDVVTHFHPSQDGHRAWLQSRDSIYQALMEMDRAIAESDKTGVSPIDLAYLEDVPTTLMYVRDHPGVTGRDATRVITDVHEARALLGAYPEGLERARRLNPNVGRDSVELAETEDDEYHRRRRLSGRE